MGDPIPGPFDILLPSSEYKIIKFLALNGPSNRWEIHNGIKIKYPTVYSAVKRLLEKFFIDIFDVGKARTGFDKPSYFATYIGKLVAMATLENEDADLDLIATSEPRQFLILEQWEYIRQSKEARNYVLSIIKTSFLDLLRTLDVKTWKIHGKPTALNIFRYELLRIILWDGNTGGGVPKSIDRDELIQFFMDNPKLREGIKEILLIVEDEAIMILEDIGAVSRDYGLEMKSDFIKDWFNLPNMTGKERAEAEARLEEWLRNKAKLRRTIHT